jgi:hypothetical protein
MQMLYRLPAVTPAVAHQAKALFRNAHLTGDARSGHLEQPC